MENNNRKSTQTKKRFVISLFPLSLLLFQAVLLVFDIFKIQDIEAVNSMHEFLRDSSLFLSLLFLLLFGCFLFTTLSKKKGQRDWKYTLINSGICAANIVLLNEWYRSDKLESALSSLLEKPVFVILTILILIVLTVIALQKSKVDDSDTGQTPKPQPDPPINSESTPSLQPVRQQTTISVDRNIDKSKGRLMFIIILSIMAFGIGLLVYFLISKYELIAPILSDQDTLPRYLSYALLIIIGIAAVIVLVIVITYITQYVCKTILSLPGFLEGKKQPAPRIVKVAFGVIGVPVFFGLTKLFKINMDWLLDLLHKRDYLVVPFTILLYFILSLLFVEILYDLFSGRSEKNWAVKFKNTIRSTGNTIMDICDDIVTSFLGLLKFPPDFLRTIEELLLDIHSDEPDDEVDNSPKGEGDN